MRFHTLLILLTATIYNLAHARKPAVEEFVGIEPETYRELTKDTVYAYDFNQNAPRVAQKENGPSNWFSVLALFAFISLPMLFWLTMGKDKSGENYDSSVQNNVSFVDFEKKNSDSDDDKDDFDKAS